MSAVLVILYRYVCIWENKRRDRSGIAEGYGNAYQDDLTDKTVSPSSMHNENILLILASRIPSSDIHYKR